MKPPHAIAEDRCPVKVARLQLRGSFISAVIKHDRWSHAVTAIAVNSRDVWSGHSIMLKPFIDWRNAHRFDASGDQFSDRVIDHGRGDAGLQPKAISQVRSHVVFAA